MGHFIKAGLLCIYDVETLQGFPSGCAVERGPREQVQ